MDGYVAFGRALAAERNAREWQNYARNLETQIRQLKAKLSSTAQNHQETCEVLRLTVELLNRQQARAAALDALQNKLAVELAKFSPNNPLVPSHFRAMIVEKAAKAGLAPQQVKLKP